MPEFRPAPGPRGEEARWDLDPFGGFDHFDGPGPLFVGFVARKTRGWSFFGGQTG